MQFPENKGQKKLIRKNLQRRRGFSRIRARKRSFRPVKCGAGKMRRGSLATKKHTLGRLQANQDDGVLAPRFIS